MLAREGCEDIRGARSRGAPVRESVGDRDDGVEKTVLLVAAIDVGAERDARGLVRKVKVRLWKELAGWKYGVDGGRSMPGRWNGGLYRRSRGSLSCYSTDGTETLHCLKMEIACARDANVRCQKLGFMNFVFP